MKICSDLYPVFLRMMTEWRFYISQSQSGVGYCCSSSAPLTMNWSTVYIGQTEDHYGYATNLKKLS